MPRFLCIYLEAPLASFGEAAGNAQRATADRPTRSALLGLAAAALGIGRDDSAAQAALASGFSIATRTIDSGILLTDFHTFEGVTRSKAFHTTRARALRSKDRNTSITRREYRSGGAWQVAYREREGSALTIESLQAAFRHPAYTLWAGRKSCPLSHPLEPVIVEAGDLADAFARAHALGSRPQSPFRGKPTGGTIASDDRTLLAAGNRAIVRNRRMDDPEDRTAWTFRARNEYVISAGETET